MNKGRTLLVKGAALVLKDKDTQISEYICGSLTVVLSGYQGAPKADTRYIAGTIAIVGCTGFLGYGSIAI